MTGTESIAAVMRTATRAFMVVLMPVLTSGLMLLPLPASTSGLVLLRQNYLTQVDFESFKESGGIEYTADVVWGLQLEVLHDALFNSASKINEKRQKIKEA